MEDQIMEQEAEALVPEEAEQEIGQEPQQETGDKPVERDFAEEVRALYEARPELRGEQLPEEVTMACVRGVPLKDAYAAYAKKQNRTRLVQEQNSRAEAKAPVRGVSRGGSIGSQAEDAFLKGFNEAW